jgi:hypothetical protein
VFSFEEALRSTGKRSVTKYQKQKRLQTHADIHLAGKDFM